MKVRIEVIDHDEEEMIIIKCKQVDERIQKLEKLIQKQTSPIVNMVFYKANEEYYFSLSDIYFFETDRDEVYAHTANDAYKVKYRLYELEKELPAGFVRVSKSTIINVLYVYSIQRNLSASSKVMFRDSYKEVYVSRMYYKVLKYKLQERNE